MTNLWDETVEVLDQYSKTFDDVCYIKGNSFNITKENFERVARKTNYNAGYGSAKVAIDLQLVGDGWWLERWEYDGAEWWLFKILPPQLQETKEVKRLAGGMWNTLAELNDLETEV